MTLQIFLSVVPCAIITLALLARSSLLQPDVEGWPEGSRVVRWSLDLMAGWFAIRGAAALFGAVIVKLDLISAWVLALCSILLFASLYQQRQVPISRSFADILHGIVSRLNFVRRRKVR